MAPTSSPRTLRICMLNADVPVPAVYAQRAPTYGRIFYDLLSTAASNIATKSSSSSSPPLEDENDPNCTIKIESTDFDVTKNEYPSSLSPFDAIVISGSASSAYDEEAWIKKLISWIQQTYEDEPRVKIFGSCFGHQVLCHALLSKYGVKVEKDAKGWELGVKEVELHDGFQRRFCGEMGEEKEGGCVQKGKLRLQFVHHDHVVIPSTSSLPPSWMTVGKTSHCAVQGVYEPSRVLTFQGHFEFDRFVNSETIKHFFKDWEPKALEEVLEAIDRDDDSGEAAEVVVRFFLEEGEGKTKGEETWVIEGGLLTPPSME